MFLSHQIRHSLGSQAHAEPSLSLNQLSPSGESYKSIGTFQKYESILDQIQMLRQENTELRLMALNQQRTRSPKKQSA